jgi:pyruvate/2-oxoglutarate dehydrogenase complex dihydrolipoamide dehydrogenase (E3) component
MKEFDAVIIGGGQAGNPLAQQLASRGWKVAFIEREYLGGSCINYGCTPTKKMIASAKIAYDARRAADYGINVSDVQVDLPKIVKMKNELVASWRGGLVKRAEGQPNISLIHGEAYFTGDHRLEVNGQELTAPKIFINTGAQPLIPPIEGLQTVPYFTNLNMMDVEEVPQHLVVIGGGYIGLEFGQMYRRFGSQVTIIEPSAQIAAHEDEDVAQALQQILENEQIRFYLKHEAVQVKKTGPTMIQLQIKNRENGETQTITGSHLLIAAGQKPNSEALNLSAAGIATDKQGYITVNEYLETNIQGIYALGDIKGGPKFTHVSYDDYLIVYHNLFNKQRKSTRGRILPYALYTDPELGRVGMTEREARQSGRKLKLGKIPMSSVARAIERGETQGFMKVVIDAETEKILGAAILGVDGGELVQTLMGLMMAGAPWTIFYHAMFIHPTLTEGFYGLMDSVKDVE